LVFREGYSGLQLLAQIHARVIDGSALAKTAKQKMAIAIGKVEKKLNDGADEELQILQLLTAK
jgi:replication factor C subunit 2/4